MTKLSIIGVIIFWCSIVGAEELQHLNETEIDARLKFLDARLNELNRPSSIWQYGWTGFYGVSSGVQLYKGIDENDSDDEIKYYVGAAKSAAGVALFLLKPLPIIVGLDDYRNLPKDTKAQKLARLREAESLMQHEAIRADNRYNLKPHLMTIGLNLLGGAVIAAFGDSDDAIESTAVGIAIGEAAIWSHPKASQKHWDAYQHKFNHKDKNAWDWKLIPGHKSIALQVKF